MRLSKCLICVVALGAAFTSSTSRAEWRAHEVRQLDGRARQIDLPARFQIVTESWHRVVAVPYMVMMPEKDRLLMLVGCDYPHRAFVLTSDDHGATWSDPRPVRVDANGKPSVPMGTGLAYLGAGKVFFYAGAGSPGAGPSRWFSRDYGKSWGDPVPIGATPDGEPWYIWDPPLVDRDPKTGKVTRLAETGYNLEDGQPQAYLRFSRDEGKTWSKGIKPPQWRDMNEVTLCRTGAGDLLAACRTGIPARLKGETLDHFEGLGTCISKDDGLTWSPVEILYEYGRHHPSLILMPNRDIVMTYVVRKGYVDTKAGFPQFGIEAVVSHDDGRTWDLDHRYILHVWVGKRKGSTYWWPSSQATSSLLLPDETILTLFGTGYRIEAGPKSPQAPRDVGLVAWKPNPKGTNADRTIRDAAFDSEVRNLFDPAP